MVTILNHTIVYIYISTHYILRPLNSEYILIIVITSLSLVPKMVAGVTPSAHSQSLGVATSHGGRDEGGRTRGAKVDALCKQCFGRLDTLFDHKTCGIFWDIVGYYGILWDIMGYLANLLTLTSLQPRDMGF